MIETTIAILLAASFLIFGAYCIAKQFAREPKRPSLPDYEIALIGDRHTADVINLFGTHRPIV